MGEFDKTAVNVIGLMSGTSLDGVDLVYVSFGKETSSYSFKILKSKTYEYSQEWEHKLKNAFNESNKVLQDLDVEYGLYLGNLINTFIKDIEISEIDFIASHGHTIFHKPEEGITLQIGDGESICKTTNLKVICDFRSQDVALGGQGAPLVPIGDQLLFHQYDYCLNLGGFANISFDTNGERKAFDICPVNIVMNHYAKLLGFNYDDKGVFASEGKVNTTLLSALNNLPFYTSNEPKSLGYEFIVETIFPMIDSYNLSEKDVLRTFISHIVYQIERVLSTDGKLLITGGGAFNDFLIEELSNRVKNEIILPSKQLIDFKEALIFAFLGVLRNNNEVNCLKSVTGARKDHCSGVVFL